MVRINIVEDAGGKTGLLPDAFSLEVSCEFEPLRSLAHLLGIRLCSGNCSTSGVEQTLRIAAEQEAITTGELTLIFRRN